MKIISVLTCLTLACAAVSGQVRQPHALYFLETIPQVTQMNPAFQPRANGYLTFPFVNFNVDIFSDLAVKNLFQKQGNEWYAPFEEEYDYKKLYNSIGKKSTMFNYGFDLDILGFGFRTGNGYFTFGVSQHIVAGFAIPSDFFRIFDNGFPERTLDFSPMLPA